MIKYLKKDRWSPYVVGLLIGVLLTIIFAFGHQIGASSGIARIGALLEEAVAPAHTAQTPYFSKLLANHVIFDWKILFIVGLFFGSLIASKLSTNQIIKKNQIWESSFGTSKYLRYIAAFIGGALLLFGARLANGCTSGHAISGGAQLSITSWVFMLSLFATAIPTSLIFYRKKRS